MIFGTLRRYRRIFFFFFHHRCCCRGISFFRHPKVPSYPRLPRASASRVIALDCQAHAGVCRRVLHGRAPGCLAYVRRACLRSVAKLTPEYSRVLCTGGKYRDTVSHRGAANRCINELCARAFLHLGGFMTKAPSAYLASMGVVWRRHFSGTGDRTAGRTGAGNTN